MRVRSRFLTLAAVGDINLGDGPGALMARHGYRYPWLRVAPTLRAADIAFGNLECAVSTRGRPVPKQYNFRGRPRALRAVARFAGFDVLNLANNHSVDYGRLAFGDTMRHIRRLGMTPVGGGRNLDAAERVRVVTPPRPARRLRGLLRSPAALVLRHRGALGHRLRDAARHQAQRPPCGASRRRGRRHVPLGRRARPHPDAAPASLRPDRSARGSDRGDRSASARAPAAAAASAATARSPTAWATSCSARAAARPRGPGSST